MSGARDLEGLGVVVTRPLEPARALARSLEARGARVFVFPALAIEYPAGRADIAAMLQPFERPETAAAARAERATGLVVEGSCEVPLGAHARIESGRITLEAFLGMPDGTRLARARGSAAVAEAESLGRTVAGQLLDGGGREILARLKPAAAGTP